MNITKPLSLAAILSLATAIPNAYAIQDGQTFKDWKGKCASNGGKQFCSINQTVFDGKKNPVVDIFIRKTDGKKGHPPYIARIKVPLGVYLPAGMGLAVDKKGIANVPYTDCDPAGCNATVPLSQEVISKMKKGNALQIGMMLPVGNAPKEMVFSASLSGVTKALGAL